MWFGTGCWGICNKPKLEMRRARRVKGCIDDIEAFWVHLTKRKGKTVRPHEKGCHSGLKANVPSNTWHYWPFNWTTGLHPDHTYNMGLILIILGWLAGLCYFPALHLFLYFTYLLFWWCLSVSWKGCLPFPWQPHGELATCAGPGIQHIEVLENGWMAGSVEKDSEWTTSHTINYAFFFFF